jgi:tetratricopeptide (TPR) repeat protein
MKLPDPAHARSSRLAVALLLVTVLSACGPSVDPAALPPLPEPNLEGALPAVHDHIQDALGRAEQDALDASAVGELGRILTAYGLTDAADAAFQRARMLEPDVFRWHFLHGKILGWAGRHSEAQTALRAALALEPRHPGTRVALAEALIETGAPDESRTLFEAVVAEAPDNLAARYRLGRQWMRAGQPERAVEQFEAALAIDERIGTLHYALAAAYRQQGRQAKSERHLALYDRYKSNAIEDLDPVRRELGGLHRGDRPHMVRAQAHFRAGRLSAAVEELNQALTVNPENDAAHMHLVWLHGRLGGLPQAEHHYDRAVAIYADNPQLHFNWGALLVQAGRLEEARATLGKVLELEPDHVDANVQLGHVLIQLGQSDSGQARLRHALSLAPGQRNAHYLLGRELALAGNSDVAIGHLKQALEPEDGRTPLFLRTLAGVYESAGDTESARKALERGHSLALRQSNHALAAQIEEDLHRLEASDAVSKTPVTER